MIEIKGLTIDDMQTACTLSKASWGVGYEDDEFVGFMVIFTHQTMAYLFFLAIDSSCRLKGHGSQALSEMLKKVC